MNIQDISDFFDLVKNPSKYEAVLKGLKEEQERLNAVIETVGKASQIDALRKRLDTERALFEKKCADREAELDKKEQETVRQVAAMKDDLKVKSDLASKAKTESDAVCTEAKQKLKELTLREKEVAAKEKSVAERQEFLAAQIADYEERIAKLKSVMG